jgi:hypothetical protein
MLFVSLGLPALAGALGLALYGIGATIAQHWPDFRDTWGAIASITVRRWRKLRGALAGRPRLFASTEPDRWRSVHRRADRRRVFAPADPAPSTAHRSKRA